MLPIQLKLAADLAYYNAKINSHKKQNLFTFGLSIRDLSKHKNPKEIRNTHINIGTGKDISIMELAQLIKDEVINYKGKIEWDISKPDGTYQKLLDVSKLHKLGWKDKIKFLEGIKEIYNNYKI